VVDEGAVGGPFILGMSDCATHKKAADVKKRNPAPELLNEGTELKAETKFRSWTTAGRDSKIESKGRVRINSNVTRKINRVPRNCKRKWKREKNNGEGRRQMSHISLKCKAKKTKG